MSNAPTGPLTIVGSKDTRDWLPGKILLARPNAVKDADGFDWRNAEFRWYRNGVEISGGKRYTLTRNDVGAEISVRMLYTDGAGNLETVASDATLVPVPVRQLGLVELAYQEILGRTPDGPGWQHYQAMLDAGDVPLWQVIQYIEQSPEALKK